MEGERLAPPPEGRLAPPPPARPPPPPPPPPPPRPRASRFSQARAPTNIAPTKATSQTGFLKSFMVYCLCISMLLYSKIWCSEEIRFIGAHGVLRMTSTSPILGKIFPSTIRFIFCHLNRFSSIGRKILVDDPRRPSGNVATVCTSH